MSKGVACAPALRAVHMFWHGPPLSRLERLCMASFVANGHPLHLHVYDEPAGVPRGVQLTDAEKVLPRRYLFTHAKSGSFAIFADWFRYRLLYEYGGIWVDTDELCLRPFDYPHAEIFGWQDERVIAIGVLGLPKGHELAKWMAQSCEYPNRFQPYDSLKTRRRKLTRRVLGQGLGKTRWDENGPVGLTAAARHLGYDHHALPFWHFYPIHYLHWRTIYDASLRGNYGLLANSYGIHLWNEFTRREPGFDKNRRFSPDSLFEQLCARYLGDL